jgi:hypothetical protein
LRGAISRSSQTTRFAPGAIETVLARAEEARGIHASSVVDVQVVTTAELGGVVPPRECLRLGKATTSHATKTR